MFLGHFSRLAPFTARDFPPILCWESSGRLFELHCSLVCLYPPSAREACLRDTFSNVVCATIPDDVSPPSSLAAAAALHSPAVAATVAHPLSFSGSSHTNDLLSRTVKNCGAYPLSSLLLSHFFAFSVERWRSCSRLDGLYLDIRRLASRWAAKEGKSDFTALEEGIKIARGAAVSRATISSLLPPRHLATAIRTIYKQRHTMCVH